MSEKFNPAPEEVKKAEDSMSIEQALDSNMREISVNHWETRPTPEALRTELGELLRKIDSFRGKISDRSYSGKERQKHLENTAGVDTAESAEYYKQLKSIRSEFIKQLNHRTQEAGFSDTLDSMPGH